MFLAFLDPLAEMAFQEAEVSLDHLVHKEILVKMELKENLGYLAPRVLKVAKEIWDLWAVLDQEEREGNWDLLDLLERKDHLV